MSIKVNFEIGHEASIRTKRTPEGFTHDWEVFVRGVDNADISQFVDRVIFQLHETFPKPKRVVKEPPYSVKESGYAGFNLPIEIYLKNQDEPKKIRFTYDLHLQPTGPPLIKVQKEKYVFSNPSDNFKRKLLKGGGMIVNNPMASMMHINIEHERNSRDSFTDEKPSQLIGKPKLGGENAAKKHKSSKEHRSEDIPRPSNSFEKLFGPPIHKISRISPDPKKPSPNPKGDKKDKEKIQMLEKEKLKSKYDSKDYRDEKVKPSKDEKDRLKEEKRMKSHKDPGKEKSLKRPAERPISPLIPPKRSIPQPVSPLSPIRSNGNEDDYKIKSDPSPEVKNKSLPKQQDDSPSKDKKKKDKKSHDKDREAKKEHKKEKERESKSSGNSEPNKEFKQREMSKDIANKETLSKEREKTSSKSDKPFNKFSIENMLKDPEPKRKDKGDRERKHKHKKKDKKRDSSRDRNKDSNEKDKKHKHEKHSHKESEKTEPHNSSKEEKNSLSKALKEKERIQMTASPISIDTSSQSSSKSIPKVPPKTKTSTSAIESRIESIHSDSDSQSNVSVMSEDENISINSESNSRSSKKFDEKDKNDPRVPQKRGRSKEKTSKPQEKAKKKKLNKSEDHDDELIDHLPTKKGKGDSSPRLKSDTKVQDDGVSSSLSDHPLDSTCGDDPPPIVERKPISPDYMIQLRELQRRIMTIQSNDELERVVNLIAETGKYELTKKTFDFDLCLLDRSTVQQLQELIGCESRA